jgi:hypothetical protein
MFTATSMCMPCDATASCPSVVEHGRERVDETGRLRPLRGVGREQQPASDAASGQRFDADNAVRPQVELGW